MESDRRTSLKDIENSTASAGGASSQESRPRKLDYGENPAATKPKPVITRDSQAQGIAKFAGRTTYEDLILERRERLKVSVLDSSGCAITALGMPPNRGVSGTGANSSAVRKLDALWSAVGKPTSSTQLSTTRHSSATSTSWTAILAVKNFVTRRITLDQFWPRASTPDDQAKNS